MSFVCEKHREETGEQQPGICPSCLRERLAQLNADRTTTGGLGLGLGLGPGSVWSDLSPRVSCHVRHGSDVTGSGPIVVEEALRKSSSMSTGGERGDENRRKKKKGFWSKLTKMTWQKMIR